MLDAKTLGEAVLAAAFPTTIAKTETLNVAMADMPINSILELLRYGAQRKFNDAIGGSDKSPGDKVAMAKSMLEDFKTGVIGKRRESASVDARTTIARQIMFAWVRPKLSKEQKAKIKAMEADARVKWLDDMIARNKDTFDMDAKVDAELARRAEEAKALASMDIEINL